MPGKRAHLHARATPKPVSEGKLDYATSAFVIFRVPLFVKATPSLLLANLPKEERRYGGRWGGLARNVKSLGSTKANIALSNFPSEAA